MMREAIEFTERHRGLIALPTLVANEDSERADVIALLEEFECTPEADATMVLLAEIAAEYGYDAARAAAMELRAGTPLEWVRAFRPD